MRVITAGELKREMERRDVLVINALDEATFNEEHIPGSNSVPLDRDDFVEQVERLAGDKDREIVVHCASRECDTSERAASRLEKAGFRNVRRFRNGMAGWKDSGFDVETGMIAGV